MIFYLWIFFLHVRDVPKNFNLEEINFKCFVI